MALASSIQNIEHIRQLDDTVANRIENFPVTVVMTMLIQILESSALTTMADDFLVNGIGGFAQASSEQEKRDILQNALRIRRKMGTVGAVKRAVETLGFSTPEIIEGAADLPIVFDGSNLFNGNINFQGGNNGWATFVIILPEQELVSLTTEEIQELVDYINYYKNERSELIGIGYYDAQAPEFNGGFVFDGTINFDGNPQQTIIFVT